MSDTNKSNIHKRAFDKEHLPYRSQAERLIARGLIVEDITQLECHLQNLNYYRLSAYWRPFEEDNVTHKFKPETNFQQILDLYMFDRELRLLILDSIEIIEVSVRARWAYQVGLSYGSHPYKNAQCFKERVGEKYIDDLIKKLKGSIEFSKEAYISHYKRTYEEKLPPIWVACEVMTLGTLHKWYTFTSNPVRKAIAESYGIAEPLFDSWLDSLVDIRNLCAHHSRIWNRDLAKPPKKPHYPKETKKDFYVDKMISLHNSFVNRSTKMYNVLLVINYFMDVLLPNNNWYSRLEELTKQYSISRRDMGFPSPK